MYAHHQRRQPRVLIEKRSAPERIGSGHLAAIRRGIAFVGGLAAVVACLVTVEASHRLPVDGTGSLPRMPKLRETMLVDSLALVDGRIQRVHAAFSNLETKVR